MLVAWREAKDPLPELVIGSSSVSGVFEKVKKSDAEMICLAISELKQGIVDAIDTLGKKGAKRGRKLGDNDVDDEEDDKEGHNDKDLKKPGPNQRARSAK